MIRFAALLTIAIALACASHTAAERGVTNLGPCPVQGRTVAPNGQRYLVRLCGDGTIIFQPVPCFDDEVCAEA